MDEFEKINAMVERWTDRALGDYPDHGLSQVMILGAIAQALVIIAEQLKEIAMTQNERNK